MRRRPMWLVAGLMALGMVTAACGQDQPAVDGDGAPAFTTIEDGILTVGTDIPFPPFESREGGEEVGFEIDLMDEIGNRLGFDPETEVVYVDSDFDTIFSDLAAGQFDVVIAATTITPEREETVNFSDPYFLSQQALIVLSGSDIQSVDDLGDGHVVAVQDGTTGEAYAEENFAPNGVEVRAFPESPDVFVALEAEQVDAAFQDEGSSVAEVAARQTLEIAETVEVDEFYGIAVNPENSELLDAVNEALGEIIADGTYADFYSRYPDLPPGGDITVSA